MAPLPIGGPLPPPLMHNNTKQTPSKPLIRRRETLGGTVRTCDEAGFDLDASISSTPQSPSKRARTVSFSPIVETHTINPSTVMVEFAPNDASDLEAVRVEVRFAIEEHLKGGSEESYDALKELFLPAKRGRGSGLESPSSEKLKMHLIALTSCVSLLGRNCSGLVKAILDCEWMGRDEGFVKMYVQFLGNLASAQGAYVGILLTTLVGKLVAVRLKSGRLPDYPNVNRDRLIARVHMALKYLLRLIPSASGTLLPILSAKFPFPEETKRAHMTYINSLVGIIDFAPELKSEILALITERLVKIDVQMQVDLDDGDDEVATAIMQAIASQPSRIEDEDGLEGDDSDADSISSDESVDNEEARIKKVQDNVEKMDAILDKLFSIYTPYFSDPHSVLAQTMFDTLLSHFRNIILPTYHSRHTQFLLFHFAQTSEHLVDTFAGECVDLAFKSGRPAVLKQSAAAYLASFVARGAHVLPHVVRDVFDYIGTCLDTIRNENEVNCCGPDLQRYSTFYATTQALLYIFCFRWRDLVTSSSDGEVFDEDDPAALLGQDLDWHPGVKELLSRTIYSKLNPLKICAPLIVEEFANIAHKLNFMYVYPLLETNKRIRLSQFALGARRRGSVLRESAFLNGTKRDGGEESWHQLDAYFPFDPYHLPLSRKWIEEDYVIWKGIPGVIDEDDEDESSDGQDEENGDVDLDEDNVDTATDDDDEK